MTTKDLIENTLAAELITAAEELGAAAFFNNADKMPPARLKIYKLAQGVRTDTRLTLFHAAQAMADVMKDDFVLHYCKGTPGIFEKAETWATILTGVPEAEREVTLASLKHSFVREAWSVYVADCTSDNPDALKLVKPDDQPEGAFDYDVAITAPNGDIALLGLLARKMKSGVSVSELNWYWNGNYVENADEDLPQFFQAVWEGNKARIIKEISNEIA